ncbi:hypothetical protein RJT34_14468 [Clitoria ternatea]|uniref:Replication protein A 70 kDa DNA-binding subunit B/D first OB fold domain-containing protein n=1 Tax=Clitoria ternatea TaxID=43366 RepID=A0AAN9PL45_CLITE
MRDSNYKLVANLDDCTDKCKIMVRIIRLWNHVHAGSKDISSIKMILMDEKGSKIHASIFKRDLISRHKGILIDGRCYTIYRFTMLKINGEYKTIKHDHRIMFNYGTKVKVYNVMLPINSFDFVPFNDVLCKTKPQSQLVDIIGVMSECGQLQDFQYAGSEGKKISFDIVSQNDENDDQCTTPATSSAKKHIIDYVDSSPGSALSDVELIMMSSTKLKKPKMEK